MGNSYFGSKATAGLCQSLIALMPPHSTCIETHLGGGAIMKRKPPALLNIDIDLNERALAGLQCEYPVELVQGSCHRFAAYTRISSHLQSMARQAYNPLSAIQVALNGNPGTGRRSDEPCALEVFLHLEDRLGYPFLGVARRHRSQYQAHVQLGDTGAVGLGFL